MKKKTRKEKIEELASIIGEGVHTGLRKYSEHPQSGPAWKAISKIDDGSWENICEIVAEQII